MEAAMFIMFNMHAPLDGCMGGWLDGLVIV